MFGYWEEEDAMSVLHKAIAHKKLVLRSVMVESARILSFSDGATQASLTAAFPQERHLHISAGAGKNI